jgi:hypothetical protein
MNRNFLKHLLFLILGYALAVAVASALTVFVKFAPTVLPDNGAWGSAYKALETLPVFLMFGAFYTAMFALPGWLISVVMAERNDERRKYWFAHSRRCHCHCRAWNCIAICWQYVCRTADDYRLADRRFRRRSCLLGDCGEKLRLLEIQQFG